MDEPTTHKADPGRQPSETFGTYLVFDKVGAGGMATVHRAKEIGIEGFERTVALKRLLPHLCDNESFVQGFVREAKVASYLQHANIVQLYDLGKVGETYFIAMEYIDGRDLRRVLRQARRAAGTPPIEVVISLLLQLCDALDYAHTRTDDMGTPIGLVHRDISPSNLLVTPSGHLKVIDFGIAKARTAELGTSTGRVKGKLAYLAPEALQGSEVDARTDIFSAGVIAYELLTAKPLFSGRNDYETIQRVRHVDPRPPSELNPACPDGLDDIVFRAIEKDPTERFQTAAEMRDALLALCADRHINATHRETATWLSWAFSVEPNATGLQEPDPGSDTPSSLSPLDDASSKLDGDGAANAAGQGRANRGSVAATFGKRPAPSPSHPGMSASGTDGFADGRPADRPTIDTVSLVLTAEVPDESDWLMSTPLPRPGPHQGGELALSASLRDHTLVSAAPPPPKTINATERPNRIARGTEPPVTKAATGRRRHARYTVEPVGSGFLADGVPDGEVIMLDTPRIQVAHSIARGSGSEEAIASETASMRVLQRRTATNIGDGIVATARPRPTWLVGATIGGALLAVAIIASRGGSGVDKGRSKAPAAETAVPAPAVIDLAVEPADAQVIIDGAVRSAGRHELAPGQHTLEVSLDGHQAFATTLVLADGQSESLSVKLTPVSVTPFVEPQVKAPLAAADTEPVTLRESPRRMSGKLADYPATAGLPAIADLKVCIDGSGAVTSAHMRTALPAKVRRPVRDGIKDWTFEPHVADGFATPACFTLSVSLAR